MWIDMALMGLDAMANEVKKAQAIWDAMSEDERRAFIEHKRKLELAKARRCTLWSWLGLS